MGIILGGTLRWKASRHFQRRGKNHPITRRETVNLYQMERSCNPEYCRGKPSRLPFLGQKARRARELQA